MLGGAQAHKKSQKADAVARIEVLDARKKIWRHARPLKVSSSFHASALVPKEWFAGDLG